MHVKGVCETDGGMQDVLGAQWQWMKGLLYLRLAWVRLSLRVCCHWWSSCSLA
jgi:hypothetical protein